MKVIAKQGEFKIPRNVVAPFRDYVNGNVETTRDWVTDFKQHIRTYFRSKGVILTSFKLKK